MQKCNVSVKPVITVWAEERGRLDGNFFDFSFGDSARTMGWGYPMMSSGRILKMGLSGGTKSTIINVTVNNVIKGKIEMTDAAAVVAITTFNPPLEVEEGDVLNFKPAHSENSARATIVTILIELDM